MENRKAVLYARCNHKDEDALSKQMDTLRTYAEKNNYEVIREYTDFGCDAPTERTGMASLLTDAVKGNVDTLLLKSMDRISRKTEEMIAVAEILDTENVEIITVDAPGSDIHALVNMFREQELAYIAQQQSHKMWRLDRESRKEEVAKQLAEWDN